MSPLGWCALVGVLLLALGLVALGVRIGLRLAGALPSATPDPERQGPARAFRPGKDPAPEKDLTWLPTAVYTYWDRSGAVLYVGIAANPGKRARQHAGLETEEVKAWWPKVDPQRTEAYWMPNRIAACCVEWALIHYLRPPYNTAPGSSDDSYCQDQPPIRPAVFEVPSALPGRLRHLTDGSSAREPAWSPHRRPPRATGPVRAVRAVRPVRAPEDELDGADAWGPYPQ